MRLREAQKDHFRRQAKRRGLRSRAAFKLLQVDGRFKILKQSDTVVDFGCAPGGWLQAASDAVGPNGRVIGIDIRRVEPPSDNVTTLQLDVNQPDLCGELKRCIAGRANVFLSDLAPNVSGIWELDHLKQIDLTRKVVAVMPSFLMVGGSAMLKAFEGEALKELVAELRQLFRDVSLVRPEATRAASSEIYLVCRGFEPRA